MSGNPPPGTVERVGDTVGYYTGWIARNVVGAVAIDLPVGVYNGLWRAFGNEVTPVNREGLRQVHQFLSTAPRRVRDLVSTQLQRTDMTLTPAQVQDLATHSKWIQAMRTVPVDAPTLPDTGANVINAGNCTAENVLRHQTVVERSRIFADYAQAAIPTTVRRRNTTIFGTGATLGGVSNDGVFTGTFADNNKRNQILDAMHAMQTGNRVNGTAIAGEESLVAEQSIKDHYFQTDATTGEILMNGTQKRFKQNLIADLAHAFTLNPAASNTMELRNGLTNSPLKAALEMNIVVLEDLNYLRPEIDRWRMERTTQTANVNRRLEQYLGATRLEQMRNAEGLGERFQNLPVLAKVLLIAGLGTFGWKRPGPSTAIGGLLFGMYFFGGRNNPIGDMGNMVRGIAGFGSGPFQEIGRTMGLTSATQRVNGQEITRRADAFVQFLGERSNTSLNATVPLAAVADVDLAKLAVAYTAPAAGAGIGNFDVDNTVFRTASRTALEARGLNQSGISRVFNDQTREPPTATETLGQRNRREMSDGIGNIFYFIASQMPEHREDARLVERARLSLPGTSQAYRDLPNSSVDNPAPPPANYNPQEIYRRLVLAGQQRALNMNQTLGTYVYGQVGMQTLDERRDESRDTNNRQANINNMITSINGYQYPGSVNTHMYAERSGTGYVVRLEPNPGDIPTATFTPEEFGSFTRPQILERWRTRVMEARRATMEDISVSTPLGANGTLPAVPALAAFHMTMVGEDILYSDAVTVDPSNVNTARTSAYKFWNTPRLQVYSRYQDWKRRGGAAPGRPTDAI